MRGNGSRSIALVSLGNSVSPIVALVTAPILARELGVVGRGELAAATAPLFLAASGFSFGVPEAVNHFAAKNPSISRKFLSIGSLLCAIFGVIGSLIILLTADLVSQGNRDLTQLILISGMALIPTLVVSALRGFARGEQLWRLVAVEQVVSAAFRLLSIIALTLSSQLTPFTACIITAFSGTVGGIVYLSTVFHRNRSVSKYPQFSTIHDEASVRTVLGFGVGVWLGVAAGTILSKLDMLLVLPLSSASELGIYAVAVSVAESVRVFNMAVRDVVFSMQSARNDDVMLARASRASTLITAAAALIIGIASIWLIPLFFGLEFSESVWVVAVLLAGAVLGNPGSVLAAGLSARGKPILRSLSILGGVIANLVGLLVLVPMFGAFGAAYASVISSFVTASLVLIFAKLHFGLKPSDFIVLKISDVKFVASSIIRRGK
ncbi:oligosaccharide flippase family protein [Glutamicibacter uratoxydans]|nr:oligosaccharide flippase family protein [Glutamicibacter uratoxydans]